MRIKVYTYCSYRFSPVGFILSVFEVDTDNENEEFIIPSTDFNVSSIICDCFAESLVQKAYGKMPDTNEYIILLKGLECDFVNEDGIPSKKYANFAFSTTDAIAYNNLSNIITNLSMEQLSEAMNLFLIPDSNAGDVALKIDVKQFINFIRNISNPSNSNESTKGFSIISSSSGDKVIKTLSECFSKYSVISTSGNNYQIKKKDVQLFPIIQYIQERPMIAIPIVVALVAAITVILILLLM